MALSYAHGSFDWLTSNALNSTQAITGLGFQPKAIRFYWMGLQSGTNATSNTNASHRGIGFAVSTTSRQCVIGYSADASAAADDATMARSGQIAGIINGSAVIGGRLNMSSFDAGGFTVIVDEVATANLTIFWEAWGGTDITNATIGQILEPAATGTVNYTATGFTAAGTDQIVMFAGCQSSNAFGTGLANDHGMCVGAATGTGTTDQWVLAVNSDDASLTMDTDKYARNGECLAMIVRAGGNPNARATLSAFGTDQFTLNWTAFGTANRKYIYLAIKGGKWKAAGGTINTTAVSNTAVVTGLGFAPIGISAATHEYFEEAAGVSTAWDSWCLGSGTSSTSRRSMGSQNEGSVADSAINLAISYDALLKTAATGNSTGNSIDIASLDSDGFTLVVDANTGFSNAAVWYGYVTFGSAATPTTYPKACYSTSSATAAMNKAGVYGVAATASSSALVALVMALAFTRAFALSATSAAALSKRVSKTFAMSAAAVPALLRSISKSFAASGTATASLTATLVTAVVQQCYASASATAALSKRVSKAFTASASATAALTTTLVTAVLQQCYASASAVASLSKRVSKAFTASATGAASLARSATLRVVLARTATATASLSKLIRKGTFGAAASATTALVRRISKRLTATAAATASAAAGMALSYLASTSATASAANTQTFVAKSDLPDLVRLILRNVTRNIIRLIVRYP